MKSIQEQFDRSYHENFYYREAENSQRNQKRLNLLMQHREGGKLLEIGCGKAGFLRLAENHFDVEGMDVSRYAIQSIKGHFGDRVRISNIEHHPLPANRYDIIVVFNILEHLRQPGEIVERLYHSLTGGGIIIGSVPNNFGLIGGFTTRIGNLFDQTHISTLSPDAWQRIFIRTGFRQIDFLGEITFGRNICQYISHNLWPHVSFNLVFVCKKS